MLPFRGLQICAYFQRVRHSYNILHASGISEEETKAPRPRSSHGGKNMILITGASGTVGREVLKQVAKSGAKHRAMYRSPEDAAKAPAHTETVVADFAKRDSLAEA